MSSAMKSSIIMVLITALCYMRAERLVFFVQLMISKPKMWFTKNYPVTVLLKSQAFGPFTHAVLELYVWTQMSGH